MIMTFAMRTKYSYLGKLRSMFMLLSIVLSMPLAAASRSESIDDVPVLSLSIPSATCACACKQACMNNKNCRCFVLSVHTPISSNSKGLYACYKGRIIALNSVDCILPEQDKSLAFSYVVTEDVGIVAQKNTIRYLKRDESLPCNWYDITLKIDDSRDEPTYSWTVDKRAKNNMPLQLPETAILILADPSIIEKVEPTRAEPINKTGTANNVVSLPTIFIKENVDAEKQSARASLALINLRTISSRKHEDTTCAVCGCSVISMNVEHQKM
ncbi:MAG: hypothetical protein UU47_C0001G0023 [candidate division TM6 bacterium GW2011_GWE2_41_16]|nr:MAG: hypothetical protein UU47_C0001G0023 [candidate division TM6 bacterium GW2011_GWE2_41_16]